MQKCDLCLTPFDEELKTRRYKVQMHQDQAVVGVNTSCHRGYLSRLWKLLTQLF